MTTAQTPEDFPDPPEGIRIPADLIIQRGDEQLEAFLEKNPLGSKREVLTRTGSIEFLPPAPFLSDSTGAAIQQLRMQLQQTAYRCQHAEQRLYAVFSASQELQQELVQMLVRYHAVIMPDEIARMNELMANVAEALEQ